MPSAVPRWEKGKVAPSQRFPGAFPNKFECARLRAISSLAWGGFFLDFTPPYAPELLGRFTESAVGVIS